MYQYAGILDHLELICVGAPALKCHNLHITVYIIDSQHTNDMHDATNTSCGVRATASQAYTYKGCLDCHGSFITCKGLLIYRDYHTCKWATKMVCV